MKNALNNQVGMLGDMFLWLVRNLKQGVIYFLKQALPPNISAGSVISRIHLILPNGHKLTCFDRNINKNENLCSVIICLCNGTNPALFQPEKNNEFVEPLFCHPQSHSKGADKRLNGCCKTFLLEIIWLYILQCLTHVPWSGKKSEKLFRKNKANKLIMLLLN